MNTQLSIKNFRVFDENGVRIDIKPMTILTGCNSSGKSSIVKALLLLCDYFSSLKTEKENGKKIVLSSYELDFTKKPHNLLGKISKVVNNKSEEKNITFEIQVHSLMLTQDVNVELVFSFDKDYFNGYISSISIKKLDGNIIYVSRIGSDPIGNLYCIFPEFERFTKTQHAISSFQIINNDRNIGFSESPMSDEDFAKYKEELKNYIESFKKEYGKETLKDINKWNNIHRFSSQGLWNNSFLEEYSGGHPELIIGTQETGIIYYLPIFDEKLSGNKKDCICFLTHCINNDNYDRATKCVLEKILEDFKKSPIKDFLEYYKTWEKNRLSEFVMKQSFPSTEKSPRLFRANHIGLKADEILMAPHNTNWGDSVDIFTGVVTSQKPKKEQEAEWESMPLNFERIYEALAILSEKYIPDDIIYFNRPNGREYMEYSSRTEYLFFQFIEAAIEEIVIDATPEALSYVSSSIINIKRIYPMESEDDFTGLLKRYMKAKRNIAKDSDYLPDTFLNDWIRRYGIGSHISIDDFHNEGLGITLRLYKDVNDQEGSLLADSGYGITQLFAILLNIEVAIMERKFIRVLPDDYTGSLPREKDIVESYTSQTIAIEEPEIHLHPNYQSKLAEMFMEAYTKWGVHFIIETHSEYLIRKFQTFVAHGQMENETISLNYIYSSGEYVSPSDSRVKHIPIKEDGSLADSFGPGFFDEADNLSVELMSIKM